VEPTGGVEMQAAWWAACLTIGERSTAAAHQLNVVGHMQLPTVDKSVTAGTRMRPESAG
jgi:hypothetical protein